MLLTTCFSIPGRHWRPENAKESLGAYAKTLTDFLYLIVNHMDEERHFQGNGTVDAGNGPFFSMPFTDEQRRLAKRFWEVMKR